MIKLSITKMIKPRADKRSAEAPDRPAYKHAFTLVLLAIASALPLSADEVKVNNIWLPQVEVLGVKDGKLAYVTSTGLDSEKPFTEIQGIKLDKYPDYEKANEAYAKSEDAPALKLLASVRKAARGKDDWVANDMGMKLAATLDRMGKGGDAVDAYLELVANEAEGYFLSYPPLRSVGTLSNDEKAKLIPVIQRALRRAKGDPVEPLKQLLATAEATTGAAPAGDPGSTTTDPAPTDPDTPTTTPPTTAPPAPGGTAPGAAAGAYPPPPQSAVLLPETLDRNEVADLVVAGKFNEAITIADGLMRSLPKPETMYLKGMAQTALADKSKDELLYKEAALNFMRVVIYFPGSPHAGPALVETGYIHDQLGLPDKAKELYGLAENQLDSETNPRYTQRLETLMNN